MAGKEGFKKRSNKPRSEFKEELLAIDRVTRVTSGGRQLRFRATVVIGNGKGKVGIGTGKSWEVVDGIAKAIADAKKNIIEVPIIKGSVPYNIQEKYKAASVMLHHANEGTGIIAGSSIRKVLALAGYKNVLAKRYGSTNLLNNARATIKALTSYKK